MTPPTEPLTFREAAERVLGDALEPFTSAVVTDRALAAALIATGGRTPAATSVDSDDFLSEDCS
jgi:hypothetical protein